MGFLLLSLSPVDMMKVGGDVGTTKTIRAQICAAVGPARRSCARQLLEDRFRRIRSVSPYSVLQICQIRTETASQANVAPASTSQAA